MWEGLIDMMHTLFLLISCLILNNLPAMEDFHTSASTYLVGACMYGCGLLKTLRQRIVILQKSCKRDWNGIYSDSKHINKCFPVEKEVMPKVPPWMLHATNRKFRLFEPLKLFPDAYKLSDFQGCSIARTDTCVWVTWWHIGFEQSSLHWLCPQTSRECSSDRLSCGGSLRHMVSSCLSL